MAVEAGQLSKIKTSDARAALGLSQRELADLAKVAPQVVVNAENGRTIRRLSAHALLQSINREREKRGWPMYAMEQLDWKVQGE